ncbi:MAG: glycosyltransferase [Planctomycetota bacterium]|nr:glycosyltransferase [Planctomycetota bacterium]
MTAPDLSVVVVNFNSTIYMDGLLASLLDEPIALNGGRATVEVILIDNASRDEDHEKLERLSSRPEVRLIRNTENVGYAIGNLQGLAVAQGRWHLVSNPDIYVRSGCVATLIDAVEALPGPAVVGPMASFDPDGHVLLPPIELADPYKEALTEIGRHQDSVARYAIRRRAQDAHQFWTASEPMRLPMLSGQFFLARRETFLQHGLFDPAYPLYYEDTDLFRRYGEADIGLWHVPTARIVHHFSRSAMGRPNASMFRNRVGARRYFRKFWGAPGERTFNNLHARADAIAADDECPFDLEVVEAADQPPTISIPDVEGVYLETAGNPKFSLAAGVFPGVAGPFTFPVTFWGQLGTMEFWCRAVEPATGDSLRTWKIVKCPAT